MQPPGVARATEVLEGRPLIGSPRPASKQPSREAEEALLRAEAPRAVEGVAVRYARPLVSSGSWRRTLRCAMPGPKAPSSGRWRTTCR